MKPVPVAPPVSIEDPTAPFNPWEALETDAMVWAEAFCAMYPDAPDTGTMAGWFANAIEVARADAARRCLP